MKNGKICLTRAEAEEPPMLCLILLLLPFLELRFKFCRHSCTDVGINEISKTLN